MDERELKVTDKRMFTPDGELREEYRHLDRQGEREAPAAPAAEEPAAAPAEPAPPAGESRPRLEIPGTPEELGGLGFVELVSLLAEPIAVYMGDVELPDGRSAENLEMARVHIDLLDVLRQKTVGNLTAEESALLEDLLYRCRLRYVQKRG